MEFLKFLVQEISNSTITFLTIGAILVSWAFGVADIVKHGWSPKEEAE